jgi:anti-sigma factor RsiW
MNCETAKNLIQPYLDGRLATLERNDFVYHVTECASCEAEVIAYRGMFQALHVLPRLDAPPRLSAGVMAALRAEGLVHEPRFSRARGFTDRFFALPAPVRYPVAAFAVIALLYLPVAGVLGNAGSSIAGAAETLARAVVWLRGLAADLPGVAGLDTYVRAARTIVHAAGAVMSPVTWLAVGAVVAVALYSMSRLLRRKRHSEHAMFSF